MSGSGFVRDFEFCFIHINCDHTSSLKCRSRDDSEPHAAATKNSDYVVFADSTAGNSMSTAANILYGNALFIGLALASGLAVFRLKRAWSALDTARTAKAPRRTWTEWIGTAIAVAWPLQLGLGFVVTK